MNRLYSLSLAALLCCTVLVASSVAQPFGMGRPGEGSEEGPGRGPGGLGMNAPHERFRGCSPLERLEQFLPPEVRESAKTLLMEHRKAIYPLQERAKGKKHELNALIATPNTSDDAINKLVDEINGLRAQIFKANVAMRKEFFKVTGVPLPEKPGRGPR